MTKTRGQTTKDILRVIVVSPSDVQTERDAITGVIDDLNKGLADTWGLRLEILRWETDAYPGFHLDGPQGLIDNILRIEESDIVIGIFWKRFGTPTKDSNSGTEHELRKAWSSWEKNKRPQVMVYFNQEPYSPKSKAETDQWGAVLEFQENFPQEGLWWSYSGNDQFERLVRNHLTAFLLQEHKPQEGSPGKEIESSFFEAPQFTDQINRASLLSLLHTKIESNSVVAVEGLPGSGKTYCVTSFITSRSNSLKEKKVLWYDPQEGETVDDFLAHISIQIPLTGLSTIPKCKELLSALYKRNMLLVIDDFHHVDAASFSNLVNAAVRYRGPANLLLISRTYVDLLRNMPEIGHVEVRGFDIEEMRSFLNKRQVTGLHQVIIESLIRKTDGLPLAASLFATLVHDFNRDPHDLLRDSMLNTERLRSWFNEVSSLIGEKELRLLHALSMCDGPFNIGVIRILGRHEDLPNVDQAFESLQRTYLVQRYSPYRWNIHHLIAMFCVAEFSEEEKSDIHRTLANYYLKGFYMREPRVLSEKEFTWKVKACKQYQLAGDSRQAQRIIQDISKTAKTRGYYETLINQSETEIGANGGRSSWIDYHYAHCCLITGRLKRGLEVIEPLLYVLDEKDSNKRVAFTRLYAEIIGSMGRPQQALEKLREILNTVDLNTVKPNVRSQATSIEAWLLTMLKEYQKAADACERTLLVSRERDDKLAEAVALTRLAIICQLTDYPEQAHNKLSDAVATFRELEDKRGLAWSLSYLAYSKLDLDNEAGAMANLQEAVRIEADIGGCSVDYFRLLKSIKNRCKNRRIIRLVDAEIRRVSWALDDLTNRIVLDI
jgi:tetratricopeptide (TPR) repeat protein